MLRTPPRLLLLLGLSCWATSGAAEPPVARQVQQVDVRGDIQALLKARCLSCHGPDMQEGELRLDARQAVLQGGVSGPAIQVGAPQRSLLLQRVSDQDARVRMPLDAPPLGADEINLLRRWIAQGAPWPDDGSPASPASGHWAYRPPERPRRSAEWRDPWVKNLIDAFVLAKLRQAGLEPSPRAEPAVLLRRLYLDLVGFPPPVEEVEAFLEDQDPAAWELVVDRLLASPAYGQRWSRPWLDAARYADSNGYQADQFRSVWPYRDWVIDALNADMPFDQFTTEQLAGDLLDAATIQQRVATGFHRLTTCNVEAGVDPEANRVEQVIDRVNTTAAIWLGATLQCAQCHDHKYDPFTQRDYYQLFAYFNNTPLEVEGDGVTYNFTGPWMQLPAGRRGQRRRRDLEQQRDQVTAQLGRLQESAAQQEPPAADDARLKQLRLRLQDVQQQLQDVAHDATLVMVEMDQSRPTQVLGRGDFRQPRERVFPAPPAILQAPSADQPANRLGLALWLTDRRNPLAARVAVNRWWMDIFGRGLVSTPEDFGVRGAPPSHPELLDWLALEFQRDWSMKRIHRLIVNSATYQQQSLISEESSAVDPQNRLLGRGPRLRLPAEMLRDHHLAASGLLDPRPGGPPIYPPQPEGVWRHVGRNAPVYETSQGGDRFRRGAYVFWRRSAPYPSFVSFDAPDRASCVLQRASTNTPLQALALMNDPAYGELALGLAWRIVTDLPHAADAERLTYGFRRCLSRPPDGSELQVLLNTLQQQRADLRRRPEQARSTLQILGPPAGINPDALTQEQAIELVAWFRLATVLLNLDEAICKS